MKDYKIDFDIHSISKSIKKYLPQFNEKRFLSAFEFAENAHRGQFRKDNKTPYIAHPVETVRILTMLHADEDTLIGALLHDVPEDTPHTLEEIRDLFGDSVAFLVDGITKLSKVHYKHNMPERQIESLKKLLLHSAKDLRVVIIKLADRLHNMQTLDNIPQPEKRLRIATETLEIYVPIANLMGIRELKSPLEELCFKYMFPTEYATISKKNAHIEKENSDVSEHFKNELERIVRKGGVSAKISIKKKNLFSIYKKLLSLGKSVDDIDNRINIRMVTKNIPDCYQILGLVHCNFLPKPNRFRDYIANPKTNGYRSLHTTVFGPNGLLAEIQIKTEDMDKEAEHGLAINFFNNVKFENNLKNSSWVTNILEMQKTDAHNASEEFIENLKLDTFQDRIFVFTPKGEVLDLPKDATAIDFAYGIHHEIGDHAAKANINGTVLPISTTLKTGDEIEVIKLKTTTPELSWLSFAKTAVAKKGILAFFKKQSSEKKIKEGHKILQKEFDIAGLGLFQSINFRKLSSFIEDDLKIHFSNTDELFISIAEGSIKSQEIVDLVQKYFRGGLGILFRKKKDKSITVSAKILGHNRFALLREISDVFYKYALDIRALNATTNSNGMAIIDIEVLVDDLAAVTHIFDEIEQIEGIDYVYRYSKRKAFAFWASAVIVSLIWIFHPFILSFINIDNLIQKHPSFTNFYLYGGVFLLIYLVLKLTEDRKEYWPIVRDQKSLWIFAFTVPILALLVLGIELIKFKLKLSWPIVFLEIFLIYAYLLISYLNFKKTMGKT